jgi:hypothetical protein
MPDAGLPPIDDEICLRIGRIVTQWTMLEKLFSLLLGTLLFADQAALSVVINSISLSAQSKWARTLLTANEKEAELVKPVLELVNRVEDLRQERNEFVHGVWDKTGCERGTCLVTTNNLDRTEIIRTRLVTLHDLDDLSNDIETWMEDYISLGRQLNFPRNRDKPFFPSR